ncbi:DUF4440 domain-containing protein [Pantoea conspicua]|uniref:DUF4440 domain-containing protein n=1 Tax=Pantoea conspicua TaxID=472705 RepID=A0A1X1BYS0_9GAMM|nr:DUF4440 domain-containing protein [Pantoea conspicua]ORM54139.1 DUF4440 domain-containing protein [Pantoea conspicua]
MNRYFREVIEAHQAIEAWLSEGRGDALLSRFDADFSMITLSGVAIDHAALSAMFSSQRAARPGLQITIDQLTLLAEWPQGAVVLYREHHHQPDQPPIVRWSSVLFTRQGERLLWRHLHETRQPE